MIICLESSVLGGYLSNEVPGLVTGLLHLAGQKRPMRVELEGNFLRDIAGCRVDFHNPCPEADGDVVALMNGLQTGHSGVMTGSYRVARLPRRRANARRARDNDVAVLPDPPGLKNLIFFEWFNDNHQRILIQSWHLQMRVSIPRWHMLPEEQTAQLRENRARRRQFLLETRRRQSHIDPADPFASDLIAPPTGLEAPQDPFITRAKSSSQPDSSPSAPAPEDSTALPDPFQRSQVLAGELRRFEKLLLFHEDVGSQPAVLRLLSTVADLAAHLGHALRQFATSNRAQWEFLIVDLEQSLPLFGAALNATEELARQSHAEMNLKWLGSVHSCLLSIELRMRELLSLLR